MNRGITITNYLVDGNPEGIIIAYVSNWTGQAIKIPRNSYFKAKEYKELDRPGIYFLIGSKEENPDEQLIYVGEANHLYDRLSTHIRTQEMLFFELIIAFSSKDDILTVSHTKYLEERIISEIVEKAGFSLVNKKAGNKISLPKMVKDEMDTYFDNLKVLLPSMGYDLFKSKAQEISLTSGSKSNKLFLETGEIKATAELTANGINVLKGSQFKENGTPALAQTYSKIRKDLIEKGFVKKSEGKNFEFITEYEFSSPSQAGSVILGYSVNGRTFWKDKSGKNLKEIEEEKIDQP